MKSPKQTTLNGERLNTFLLRSETRQGGTLSRLLFNRLLATAIRQEKKEKEKRNKGIHIGKEVKLSVY